MTTWHRARIKFQYSPKQDTNHRAITSVTTQIYGNTESTVLPRLKEMPGKVSVGMTGTYFRGDFESEYGGKCGAANVTWTVQPGDSVSLYFLLRMSYEQSSVDYSTTSICGEPYSSQSTYIFEVTSSGLQLVGLELSYANESASFEGELAVQHTSVGTKTSGVRYGRAFIFGLPENDNPSAGFISGCGPLSTPPTCRHLDTDVLPWQP